MNVKEEEKRKFDISRLYIFLPSKFIIVVFETKEAMGRMSPFVFGYFHVK
jgi:hypothetical protein